MMIEQCLGECWIILWRLYKTVEIKHELDIYANTICMFFVY